jgi:hypothetical protein
MRSGIERDMRVEENTAAGDITKLARMEVSRAVSRQANLDWKVNFVTPGLSSLSHFYLVLSIGCNSIAVGRLISPELILFTLKQLHDPAEPIPGVKFS